MRNTTPPASRPSRPPARCRPRRRTSAGTCCWSSGGKIWPAEADRGWLSAPMRRLSLLLSLPLLLATPALAQQPQPVDDLPRIRITDPTRDLLRLAVPAAFGEGA